MQTFLFIAKNKEIITLKIESLKNSLQITSWNFHAVFPEPSIGIETVRKIKQLLSLKPFGSKNRLIVIWDFHRGTIEAQNAMLKILEEPPINNYFLLITESSDKILPTVVSRCQLLTNVKRNDRGTVEVEVEEKYLIKILRSSPSERIIMSTMLSHSKEESLHFLDKLSLVLQKNLLKPSRSLNLKQSQIASVISKIEIAKSYLERNINYKATLDILFLGFPRVEEK